MRLMTKMMNKKYRYGSYPRKRLKGYNPFLQLMMEDIIIDYTGSDIVDDGYMKDLFKRQIITANEYDLYMKELKNFLGDLTQFEELSNEELYTEIHKLRLSVLKSIKKEYSENRLVDIDRDLLQTVMSQEVPPTLAINQKEIYETFLKGKGHVIIMPDTLDRLSSIFQYCRQLLLLRKKIFILVKEEPFYKMPSLQEFMAVLQDEKADDLIEALEDKRLNLIVDPTPCYGVEFTQVRLPDEVMNAIEEEDVLMLGCGEIALKGIKDFIIPAFVISEIKSFVAKSLTNLFEGEGQQVFVYVPPGFNIHDYVTLVERTKLTYDHLARLYEQMGSAAYELTLDELYKEDPEIFTNIYGRKNMPIPKDYFEELGDMKSIRDFIKLKRQIIGQWIKDQQPSTKLITTYYNLDNLKQTDYEPEPEAFKNCVLVDGVIKDEVTGAKVFLSDEDCDHVISPRGLVAKECDDDTLGFLTNFLFFLTPKLAYLYNEQRKERPKEQIPMTSGHLDYRYYKKDTEYVQSMPLYNKATFGVTKNGECLFYNQELEGGEIKIGHETILWSKGQVNGPVSEKVVVYTPMGSQGIKGQDHWDYRQVVGDGRVNIIIVNEKLITLRFGDVIQPSIGVVVSLEEEAGLALIEKLGIGLDDEGYGDLSHLKYEVSLDPPSSWDGKREWKDMAWAFGGGLTLIRDNVNLFEDEDTALKALDYEGWQTPLSKQTQESNIHELSRHPRTTIGITDDGKFFALIFSGRTKESAGANYYEVAEIAKKEVGSIRHMINLDGGASALLALICGDEMMELSYPTTSPTSCSGMAREINSMMIMK